MSHDCSIAATLLPQAPDGSEVRCRALYGTKGAQPCSSGGFFGDVNTDKKKSTSGMTQADLVKAAALTIDVDAYDWIGGVERWGATRDERKAAMRAASAGEVIAWMKATKFRDVVFAEAVKVGLPEKPNRVLYTGQGLCLVYWFSEDVGWTDENKGEWTPSRMKAAIKRFHEQRTDLWWWDRDAKDVGTRLFPVPGGFHRETGKEVRLVGGHSEVFDFKPWFADLEAKYPPTATPKKKAQSVASGPKAKKHAGKTFTGSASWTTVVHDPAKHPVLNIGEKADACPLCAGSGYKRLDEKHYTCFSCETQFSVVGNFKFNANAFKKAPAPEATNDDGCLPLTPEGYAVWPSEVPDRVVNAARTGAGKTELMKSTIADWTAKGEFAFHGDRRAIVITPTIALAGVCASRLKLLHGEAGSDVTWKDGSMSLCFASLTAKTYGLHGHQLANSYLIMDEAETTLSQLVGLLDTEKGRETYSLLVHLAARAGRVMLADAHAGPVVQRFLEDVKKVEVADELPHKPWTLWKTAPHRHSFAYVAPAMRTPKDGGDPVVVQSSDAMHRGLLVQRIGEGKKLAIYVPGHFAARALGETIRSLDPALNVQVRVRNKSNDQQNDLSENGLTADVLIYNNSMNTGVSYDVRDHYDEVHLLLGRGSVTDAVHVEQALHRVRHPKSKVYVISGSVMAPVNDWRCDAAKQLEAAIKRLHAGQAAVTSMAEGVTLASDFMFEPASKRLAGVQATIIASRYTRGYRWALGYLALHHDFKTVKGAMDKSFTDATKAMRDGIERAEAVAIAQAQPLSEASAAFVEKNGAATEDEYYAYRASKFVSVFEDAYADASSDDRAEIVLEADRKHLVEKTRLFAVVAMLEQPEDVKQAVAAEVRANSKQSIMTARVTLPTARVVDAVFATIGKGTPLVDGRWNVAPALALQAVQAALPFMAAAGLTPRTDALTSPFRQLQTVLGYAGLALRSQRVGPKGARTRSYFLSVPDVERMVKLSEAFVTRWRDHAKVDDVSQDAVYDAVSEQLSA